MNRINSFVQHFASAALHAAPAGVIALTLLGTALAATGTAPITCTSGTVINDSVNGYVPVGCLFTKWTGTEMGQCHDQGLTIFGPNNSGTSHICVLSQYASLLANGSAASADPHGPASYLNQTSAYFTT